MPCKACRGLLFGELDFMSYFCSRNPKESSPYQRSLPSMVVNSDGVASASFLSGGKERDPL